MFYDMADNWCALAVAIYYKKPLTVEAAFQVFLTGSDRKREDSTKHSGLHTLEEIDRLRKAGYRWKDINQMLCLRQARSYYLHRYKSFIRRREHEAKNMLDPSAAAAPTGAPINN